MNQSEQEIRQLSKRVEELESQLKTIKKEQADLAEQLITIKKYGLSERLHQYLGKTERAQKLSRLIVDTAGEDSRSFAGSLRSAEKVQLQETLGGLDPERSVENRLEAERYSCQLDAQLNEIEGKLNAQLGDINWDDIFEYEVSNDGIVIQKYIAFEEETITVPPYINSTPVVGIEKSAFENCKNTSTVFLPDSIKTIGISAFYSSGIITMKLPKQLTRIESSAFSSCTLTEIFIPDGVQDLGAGAFSSCDKLKYVRLPKTLKAIKHRTFYGCKSLQKIDIPMGVTVIGIEAFQNCSSLQKIDIPVGVTVIEAEAFFNCSSLQKIDIPVGVTKIGKNAFYSCHSLRHVRIPDTVSTILSSILEFRTSAIIYCNAGSVALRYARNNSIKVDQYENYPEREVSI